MTLKEMKEEHYRLGKLIREAEEGRFLKHDFLQAEVFTTTPPNPEIRFRVKLYAKQQWRTIFWTDSAEQAVADLESLRDAIEEFLSDFREWAVSKEAELNETEIY